MAFPNALMNEQANSPKITEDEHYLKVERTYQVNGRLTRDQLIQGEYVPEDGYSDPETDTFMVEWSYDSEVGYPLLTVHFQKRLYPDGVYNLHEYSIERPIAQHPSFLMAWSYELFATDTTTSVPAWAATATDKSDTIDSEVWRWSRNGPQGEYKYLRQEQDSDFRGVTTYIVGGARMTKKKVYEIDTAVNGAARWNGEIGTYTAPSEVYGLSNSDDKWLIRDYRITKDVLGWATTLEWLYAPDGWNTTIYSASSTTDDGP
jgi:hypothetical protein